MILKSIAASAAAAGALAIMGAPAPACRVVVPGAAVSQGFGCTALQIEPIDLTCPTHHSHTGIDLAAAAGTPVFAAVSGRALVIHSQTGYGIHVVVLAAGGVAFIYAHLLEAAVADGTSVSACALVGRVGSTGHSTGPHLHFEVRRDGRPVDPSPWLEIIDGHQPRR